MADTFFVVSFTAIVFVALIANIAKNQQSNSSGNITGLAAVISSIGGLFIYGYAYAEITDNVALAMVKALIATLGMFLGKNEYSSINSVEFLKDDIVIISFWLAHLLALYATTNAVLATIGAHALKHIRIWIRKLRNNVIIIYGINKDSISFGSELSRLQLCEQGDIGQYHESHRFEHTVEKQEGAHREFHQQRQRRYRCGAELERLCAETEGGRPEDTH